MAFKGFCENPKIVLSGLARCSLQISQRICIFDVRFMSNVFYAHANLSLILDICVFVWWGTRAGGGGGAGKKKGGGTLFY